MDNIKIAEIIVDNKCKETNKIYNYIIPPGMDVKIGSRVIVPFGRGNKNIAGYIIGFTNNISFEENKLKNIIKPAELYPLIPEKIIELVKWMKEEYLCYYIEAIHAVIPANVRIKTTYYYELIEDKNISDFPDLYNIDFLNDILEFISANGGIVSKEELRDNFNDNYLEKALSNLIKFKFIRRKQTTKKTEKKKYKKLLYINNMDHKVEVLSNAIKQINALEIIKNNPGISTVDIEKSHGIKAGVIKALLNKNAIRIEEQEVYRLKQDEPVPEHHNILTVDQLKAINEIKSNFHRGNHVLLHGVTGSGKTEIYLNLMEKEIIKGNEGIVLVPEISLTPQMISRFISRFGDTVAVLHSGLSDGEKYDEWRRIKEGKAKVAVGARSAIFAPFSNLGMIIIDEEHENTYKSEIRPKYDAREIAAQRCLIESCKLILGSATPTIDTYYKSKNSMGYSLVSLDSRVNQLPMPEVEIVDMREELKEGNKSIFSNSLKKEIKEKLDYEEQIILFLNRRGYSTFVSCRNCGYVVKCPHCNISLTYHAKENSLICHYCGYTTYNPKECPNCRSKYIKYFGIGTQKVENEFKKEFKVYNILRMDADTTRRKNSHKEILDRFRYRKSDILIGTQMIGKGHDFPYVTLVGIISSDTYLNMPDFRAAERTFQMVTQVAGRAGRAKLKGKVIIQTYTPEHYSLDYAKEHDYVGFYKEEIKLREEMNYPPFSYIGNIIFSGLNKTTVEKVAKASADKLEVYAKEMGNIEIRIPVEAPLSKIKNNFRWQIVLKSKEKIHLVKILKKFNDLDIKKSVYVSMDINPINML